MTDSAWHPKYTLHPMLISAPVVEKDGKNGRLEWAVMLCKLAWLRFHVLRRGERIFGSRPARARGARAARAGTGGGTAPRS